MSYLFFLHAVMTAILHQHQRTLLLRPTTHLRKFCLGSIFVILCTSTDCDPLQPLLFHPPARICEFLLVLIFLFVLHAVMTAIPHQHQRTLLLRPITRLRESYLDQRKLVLFHFCCFVWMSLGSIDHVKVMTCNIFLGTILTPHHLTLLRQATVHPGELDENHSAYSTILLWCSHC